MKDKRDLLKMLMMAMMQGKGEFIDLGELSEDAAEPKRGDVLATCTAAEIMAMEQVQRFGRDLAKLQEKLQRDQRKLVVMRDEWWERIREAHNLQDPKHDGNVDGLTYHDGKIYEGLRD